jgi:predicted Zn-dependent protease
MFPGATRLISASCAVLVIAGCAAPLVTQIAGGAFMAERAVGAGMDLKVALSEVDEKEEIAIGRDFAGRMLGAVPLVTDRGLQAYVNRVGRWIAAQSERPDLPWTFGVINDASVNAFASPGGYVLVTRGLYQILDNEAQLAGVLAHEITHVVRRHHIRLMRQTSALSGVMRAVQAGTPVTAATAFAGPGAEVFARGLDKNTEYEADRQAVVLAARAGYNPYALIDVLHKLHALGANDDSLRLLFQTHPAPGDRLARLGEAVQPKLSTLPRGREPQIRRIAVK